MKLYGIYLDLDLVFLSGLISFFISGFSKLLSRILVYLSVSWICVNLRSLRCLRLAMTAARLGCIQSSLPVMLKAWGRWWWDCSQRPSPPRSCIDHRGQCRWSLPPGGANLLCTLLM